MTFPPPSTFLAYLPFWFFLQLGPPAVGIVPCPPFDQPCSYFLNAIASPCTYPCQSVGQSVSESFVVSDWRLLSQYRISELCELAIFATLSLSYLPNINQRAGFKPGLVLVDYAFPWAAGQHPSALNPAEEGLSQQQTNICQLPHYSPPEEFAQNICHHNFDHDLEEVASGGC